MIVIEGGTVLTVDDAGHVYAPGHVVIEDDRVTAVGAGPYQGSAGVAGTRSAEKIDAAGMVVMRETGTQIAHNPSSNAKLGNGIARLPEMLAAGLNVGLGHDAAESTNNCDMFEVMKFASLIHRAVRVLDRIGLRSPC